MSWRLRVGVLALAASSALSSAPAARADEPARKPWSSVLGTARARAALLGQRPSDEAERIAAVELLATAAESAAPEATLLAALDREQAPRVREALLVALARRGRPEFVAALVAVHRRGDAVERALALRGLAGIDTEVAVRELVLGLSAADSAQSAVPALVRRGARTVPPLLRALRDAPTASAAATALGALGDSRATAPLVTMLGSESEGERVAALEALTVLGDARAADAVAARLGDDSQRIVIAALEALTVFGDASHGPAILARVRTGSVEVRRSALGALVAAEPVAGAAALRSVLGGEAPELLGAARALLLDARDAELAPLLAERLPRDAQPEALAGALAALDGGAGVATLVHFASTAPGPLQRAVAGALAVALRTWHAELTHERVEEAHDALAAACAAVPAEETLVLRAIAWDARVIPAIRAALADRAHTPRAATRRSAAAFAAGALGRQELGADVLSALGDELDPDAFRTLADAARTLRVIAPLGPLLARARDAETGPEALLLAAASLSAASPVERRQFAVLARTGLRAADERLRSSAARALALAHDVGAARALLSAVRDGLSRDAGRATSPLSALAAARALSALPAPSALASALAAEARACPDERVRAALLDATAAAAQGRAAPVEARGDEILHVRLVLSVVSRDEGVGVDVRLADGRLLRRRTLPSGELFVLDLASGLADVTLRPQSATPR